MKFIHVLLNIQKIFVRKVEIQGERGFIYGFEFIRGRWWGMEYR